MLQIYFIIHRIIENDQPSVENDLKSSLCFYYNILMKTQMQNIQFYQISKITISIRKIM